MCGVCSNHCASLNNPGFTDKTLENFIATGKHRFVLGQPHEGKRLRSFGSVSCITMIYQQFFTLYCFSYKKSGAHPFHHHRSPYLFESCMMAAMSTAPLLIAFLHLAPTPGDIVGNRRLIEQAIIAAAQGGASWILTPELVVCGYSFSERIGTDWIIPQPDRWMKEMGRLATRLRITLFLSHPERDRETGMLHNSLFVLTANGALAGLHRKIHTLRVGSESWSTPGTHAIPISVPPLERVGLLICADAFSPAIATRLQQQGARLLVSAAAWAPGHHGPNGEWERCTKETGLPLFVCNRTGPDLTMNFTKAESVVARDGVRLLSMSAIRSTIFMIEWDLSSRTLVSPSYDRIEL